MPRTDIPAPGENLLAALKMGVHLMRRGDFITDYEVKLGGKIAEVLCGGNVTPGTLMCKIYGEGEIVVNSEHRQAIQRVAKGFAATGIALDNVIEAIEHSNDNWFAVGVQWQPASASASGLDIQVFRALIDAAKLRAEGTQPAPRKMAMAG